MNTEKIFFKIEQMAQGEVFPFVQFQLMKAEMILKLQFRYQHFPTPQLDPLNPNAHQVLLITISCIIWALFRVVAYFI